MKITLASTKDYNECKTISEQFTESTPTKEVFQELVLNKSIFIAKQNNAIIGFCSYRRVWNESMFLQFLRVDKDHQRKGIASKLIYHIEKLGKDIGYYEIFSTLLESNTPSQKLHEALGYRYAGEVNFDSGREIIYLKEL